VISSFFSNGYEAPGKRFVKAVFKAVFKALKLAVQGRHGRYGEVAVSVGRELTLTVREPMKP
jgi:hypothetical protein